MARWEPDAAGRLREAALELFEEQGYEHTTVADIADRAGLSSRTFFRHYTNKRDALFGGSEKLDKLVATVVAEAPVDSSPMEVVGLALEAVAGIIGADREWGRRRNAVVTATPDLLERELVKFSRLARLIADGLQQRDVDERDAALAGEAAMAVLRVGFARWTTGPDDQGLVEVLHADLDRLAVVAGD